MCPRSSREAGSDWNRASEGESRGSVQGLKTTWAFTLTEVGAPGGSELEKSISAIIYAPQAGALLVPSSTTPGPPRQGRTTPLGAGLCNIHRLPGAQSGARRRPQEAQVSKQVKSASTCPPAFSPLRTKTPSPARLTADTKSREELRVQEEPLGEEGERPVGEQEGGGLVTTPVPQSLEPEPWCWVQELEL